MSLETQAQVQQEGWWPIAAHILKRLLLVVLAYLVAVLVTLIGVVIIYSVLSNLPAAPDYFAWFNWAPLVGILAPFAAGFIYMLALMISAVPTLLAAIVTEGLGLRQVWLHALLGAVVAGASFAFVSPTLVDGVVTSDVADVAIIAAGGLLGGAAWWLIAGRRAGIIRQPRN